MTPFALAVKEAGGPSKMASQLRCSAQAVCFYRDGKRELPERYGARIEAACKYLVRRWHIWPDDWHVIWPELIGTEGAPSIPTAAVAPAAPSGQEPVHAG